MTTTTTPTTPVRLFGNRDYLLWWGGDTGSALGAAIQGFALPLVAVLVTGSVGAGGLVATAYLGAALLLGLPGGVLVDRVDRRQLLAWQAISGLVVWGVLAALVATGSVTTAALAVLAVLGGIRAGLFTSLTNACLQQVVTTEQIPTATSANQGRDAVVGLLGSPLGGVLLGFGPAVPFAAAALLSLSTLPAAVGVRASLDPGRTESASPLADLREGLVHAWRIPVLRALISVALLVNLALGGLLTTVLFTMLQDGVPGWQLGLVEGFAGVGMLVGAVAAPTLAHRLRGGLVVPAGLVWIALFGSLLALRLDLWQLGLVTGLVGLGVAPVNAIMGGIVTTIVPADKLGRVTSVAATGAMALGSLAPALAGWGLTEWGHSPTAIAFVVLLVAGAGLTLASRPLRTIPTAKDWAGIPLAG
ncbi:MFS transporter [Propionibacteriaceae bacterium Y1923]